MNFGNRILIKIEHAEKRIEEKQQLTMDKNIRLGRNRDHLDELFDPRLVPGDKKTATREDFRKHS